MTRLIVGLVAGLLSLGAYAAPPTESSEQIADLKAQNVRIKTHPRTGAVRLIGAWPQAPLMVPSVNEVTRADVAGMEAVKHFGPMFGLTRPEQEIRLVGEKTKRRGGSRHRYRQLHKGIPVLTGELLVNLDQYRRVISMSGEISGDLDVDTRPDINRGVARRLALATVAKWYDVKKPRLRAGVPELWIVDPKILKPGDRDASLAWRIEVTDKQEPHSIREVLYIDAKTAGITMHINLIEQAKNRRTYTANNTGNLPGTLVCDESDPGCAGGDSEARNAHLFAGDTYDFYFNEHGRDSLDDAGQTLISTVHYSDFLCPNAFWNGSQMVYCAGLAVDDVVGHELTHGVTENTSQLLYYYESGAINESLSDIWGEFVDLSNSGGDDSPAVRWLIGEDLASTVGVIRNMANPPAMGDPDKMSSPYYYNSSGDNGGVHFNSGINNKAAYLMTDGDTFNGYTVNGLGIGKVADIYYEAQTNLLTSGSDYADLHTVLNQACQNLIGIDGITSGDCLDVEAAIDAVEMDTDPQNYHPDAPICIGGDPPDDLFFDDLENGTSQWNFVNVSGSSTAAWILDFGYAASGEYMLWGRDSFASTDGTAEMNVDVPLPASEKPYLHFKHSFAFEASFDFETFELAYWDGGFVEYSTDAGANWSDAGPLIDSGQAYNATLYDNPANPNATHAAFGDESHGYVSTRLDLSNLKGQSVRFRWHTSTDGSVSGPFGWVVDDVRVYTCANEPPPPAEVAFSNATYSIGEAGGAATITVTRTGGGTSAFSIDYATADGSASAGADYIAATGTLNFADGEDSRTFSVPVVDDGLVELDETIMLTLSGESGAYLGAVPEAVLTITENDVGDFAWIEDGVPAGAALTGNWNWVSTAPPPYSGGLAHQSVLANGVHQHYFNDAAVRMPVKTGDTLFAYVYLDPDNPPSEVMLQWNVGGSWDHRAYWGANLINFGVDGTDSRRYMGALPVTGQWVRLEIPASFVGLEGVAVNGMAFTLFDGRATWDATGVTSVPPVPSVTFSGATYSVSEAGGEATITVSRTGVASSGFSVDYATADGSAAEGNDYIATNGTFDFADGEDSKTFSVTVIEDGLLEDDETIVLTLSGASGANLGAVPEATLTITDNDMGDVAWIDDALPAGAVPAGTWNWVSSAPPPYAGALAHQSRLANGIHQHYFSNAAVPMQVQTGETLYTYVYLDPANPPSEVMLQWNVGGSWERRAYWGANLINFGADGTNSRRYMGPLPATGQWVRLEVPASAVGLEGAAVNGMAFTLFGGRATWDATGTTSVPPLPNVAFSDAAYSVSEAGVEATIIVSRTGGGSSGFSVDYATADGSAVAGDDYIATNDTLDFADGEDSKTISVLIVDDVLIESNETILLTLSGAVGANLGAVPEATLTITDDDVGDIAWIDDALPAGATPAGTWNWVSSAPAPYSGALAHQSTLAAGVHQHYFSNAAAPLQVQTDDTLYAYVYLDPDNPPSEVMLQWSVGGSWERRAYWGANLINFGTNGTNSRRYMGPLPATGQWVRLEVSASAVGLEGMAVDGMAFTLFDGRATWDATGVTSAPTLPNVAFSIATYSVGEADGEATITVSRTGVASGDFTVDYSTTDLSASAGADYVATNGTLYFAAGEDSQTFNVPILDDVLVEGDELIVLTLSGTSGANLGAVPEAMLTITDNDSSDFVWMDDALPAGARPAGTWIWVSTAPAPYSGGLSHQSTLAAGVHQHYFSRASVPMQVQTGDTLYAYVYLDPANPPSEVMLQWNVGGSWERRAYWGANLINFGTNGTNSRRYMGALPVTGQWVRLEVPASAVGLEGAAVRGMAFTLFDGRATWDTAGRTP